MKRLILALLLFITAIQVYAASFITETGFVSVSGGKIWYEIIYSKKTQHKIPLIVLHGGPGVPHEYLSVFKSLANERPVIFYDQLGVGRSPVVKMDQKL